MEILVLVNSIIHIYKSFLGGTVLIRRHSNDLRLWIEIRFCHQGAIGLMPHSTWQIKGADGLAPGIPGADPESDSVALALTSKQLASSLENE